MANKEIKTTIRLAGEKEYNAAIKEANRNLRTLRSELKAETAELGNNATAQQKNEARIKSLKQQIAEQEKVVATLTKALAEANRDYSDNQDVVQKWEQSLNNARATLAGMKNELDGYSQSMGDVNQATEMGVVATKSLADSISEIGGVCDSVADGIEGIFTGVIHAVEQTVIELWDLIGTTAAKANMWTDISQYWGTDAVTIQKYANTVSSVGKNFEDLEAIVTRLVLGGKGDKIAEYLGVSEVNYDNQWDYAMACMERMYELRQQGALADDFWESIFGEKKSTKAMDMLNGWGTIMESLETYDADQGGFGMTTPMLEQMDKTLVEMQTIATMWGALKDEFAAGLGEITLPMMIDVQGGLKALNDFMKAETPEEEQAALEALMGSVDSFFDHLQDALEKGFEKLREVATAMQESENGAVRALGDALQAIVSALEWIADNGETVKAALEGIFGLWLMTKLGSILALVTGIVAKIEIIKAFSTGSVGASAIGGAGSAVGTAAGSGAAVDLSGFAGFSIFKGFTKWVTAVQEGLPHMLDDLGIGIGTASSIAIGKVLDEQMEEHIKGTQEVKQAFESYYAWRNENPKWAEVVDWKNEHAGDVNYFRDFFLKNAQAIFEAMPDNAFWDLFRGSMNLDNGINNWEAAQIFRSNLPIGMWGTLFQDFTDLDTMDYQTLYSIIDAHETRMEELMGGGDRNTVPSNPEVASGIMDTMTDVSGTLSGLPGMVASAVAKALSSVKVYMDGEVVGRLTTNTVSMGIAGLVRNELK